MVFRARKAFGTSTAHLSDSDWPFLDWRRTIKFKRFSCYPSIVKTGRTTIRRVIRLGRTWANIFFALTAKFV